MRVGASGIIFWFTGEKMQNNKKTLGVGCMKSWSESFSNIKALLVILMIVCLAPNISLGAGVGDQSTDKQYKKFAKQRAVSEWSRDAGSRQYKGKIQPTLDQLLKELGLKNDALRKKVITNFATTYPPADHINNLVNGSLEQRNQVMNELLGKTMISVYKMSEDAFDSSVLKNTTGDHLGTATNVTGTVASMIGSLQANDTKGALEHLANGINNAHVAPKVASAIAEYAINRTQLEIDMWKMQEIEEAFQAYKNGAEDHNGYNVDAGDFQQVLSQMKGEYQRYISDGIKEYARKRGIPISKIDDNVKLRNKIIRDLEKKLKENFDNRIKAERVIDPMADQFENLIKELEAKELLNKYDSVAKSYFKKDDSIEFRLTRLFNIRDSIIAMIGQKKASSLSDKEMAGLIKRWILLKREGKSFEDYLKKKNLIETKTYGGTEAAWVLLEIIPQDKSKELKRKNKSYEGTYRWSVNASSNSVVSTHKYTGPTKKSGNAEMVHGENYSTTLSLSGLPDVILPGETVSVTMNAQISPNVSYLSASASSLLQVFSVNKEGKKSGGTKNCYSKDKKLQVKAWANVGQKNDQLSDSLDVEFDLGKGALGQKMAVQFATNGAYPATVKYIYEYKMPK